MTTAEPNTTPNERNDPSCALWYYCYDSIDVDLCDDEDEAVSAAYSMQEYGTGAPRGVQYSDGTFVALENWTAFQAYEERRYQAIRDSVQNAPPPPALRTVTVPWGDDKTTTVLASLPMWVGRR